jgi:chromosome segregation ATPase
VVDKIKKTILYGIVFIAIMGACFLGGYLTAKYTKSADDNTAIIAEYEARLAAIENINRELQKTNSRITEHNNRITKRLDDAKTIIDGIDGQLETDGDTIQRIVDNVQKLEYAISIIFENWTPEK